MANAIYKDYEIKNDEGFIIVLAKDGSIAGQGYKNVIEAMLYIDLNFKEPVDAYQDLDTEQTEGEPTSEEINKALGVKEVCSFMEAVEANVAETRDFIPVKERQLTEEQKHFYWEAYHEGYEHGARHKEDELLQGAVALK